MEGIPEESLREHEKRLAGKDKDEPDNNNSVKAPLPMAMPPMPPLGMMTAPPMMPMGFPGMPFGMPHMPPLPMMPVQMMAQLRPSMSMMPPVPSNPIISAAPSQNKPLFPSGTSNVGLILLKTVRFELTQFNI
jgi:hypothetical protein